MNHEPKTNALVVFNFLHGFMRGFVSVWIPKRIKREE